MGGGTTARTALGLEPTLGLDRLTAEGVKGERRKIKEPKEREYRTDLRPDQDHAPDNPELNNPKACGLFLLKLKVGLTFCGFFLDLILQAKDFDL